MLGRRTSISVVFALIGALSYAPRVLANAEPPAMYDAQTLGMGGAATAHLTTPAAIVHNPANLDLAPDTQLQLNLTSMLVRFEASFAGAGNEQKSPLIFAPLAFLGGSQRVSDRVTIGGAAYIAMGFGGGFSNVGRYGTGTPCIDDITDIFGAGAQNADYCASSPRDEKVTLVIVEAAIPLAVRLLDNLHLGIALRFPYGVLRQQTSQDIFGALTDEPTGNFGLGYAQVSSEMNGFGTPGVLFGVTYDPTPWLTLAVAYRSKTRVHLEGTTNMDLRSNELIGGLLDFAGDLQIGALSGILPDLGLQEDDTVNTFVDRLTGAIPSSTDWYMPHALELATAFHLLERRLLVAAELRIQFHREANRGLTVALHDPTLESFGFTSFTQDFDWKNVYGLNLGAQYMATETVAVRAGINTGNSATPPHTAGQFTPPPGPQYGVNLGVGVTMRSLQLDVGFAYGTGAPFRIEQQYDSGGAMVYEPTCRPGQTIKSGCPGSYTVRSAFLGVGLTYRPHSNAEDDAGAPAPAEYDPSEELPPGPP